MDGHDPLGVAGVIGAIKHQAPDGPIAMALFLVTTDVRSRPRQPAVLQPGLRAPTNGEPMTDVLIAVPDRPACCSPRTWPPPASPSGSSNARATIWDRSRQHVPLQEPIDIAEVRDSVRRIAGDDLGLAELGWSMRFVSERRQADRYRVGRVFLAGDAAHVHSPLGAMGMSIGIQDAANLSWKLAAAVAGWAPSWLLDTYHTERHRAGLVALRFTDLLLRLGVAPAPVRLLRSVLAAAIMNRRPVSEAVRRTLSGLGLAYHVPAGTVGSPSAGRRVPDLPLTVAGRTTRLFELLRGGRFLLVDVDGAAVGTAAAWQGRVDLVRAAATPSVVGPSTSPDGFQRPWRALWWSAWMSTAGGASAVPCWPTQCRPGP